MSDPIWIRWDRKKWREFGEFCTKHKISRQLLLDRLHQKLFSKKNALLWLFKEEEE